MHRPRVPGFAPLWHEWGKEVTPSASARDPSGEACTPLRCSILLWCIKGLALLREKCFFWLFKAWWAVQKGDTLEESLRSPATLKWRLPRRKSCRTGTQVSGVQCPNP